MLVLSLVPKREPSRFPHRVATIPCGGRTRAWTFSPEGSSPHHLPDDHHKGWSLRGVLNDVERKHWEATIVLDDCDRSHWRASCPRQLEGNADEGELVALIAGQFF